MGEEWGEEIIRKFAHHPLSRFSGLGAQTAATSVAPLLPELVDGGWWGFPGSQFLLTNLFVGSVSLEDAR